VSESTKPLPTDLQPRSRKLLGEIFVERGLLTKVSVERMVEFAREKNIRLGSFMETVGLVTAEELADALATQYRCSKIFDFAKYTFPPQVLKTIQLETAVRKTVFPLKLEDGKLGLAVTDPTDQDLFKNISETLQLRVIPFVSTRHDINLAIVRHYLGRDISVSSDRSILIVEDDSVVSAAMATILMKEGYSVVTATDGMEAFREIFVTKPRLIITDKEMPKLSGYGLLEAIRNIPEFRFTPVILITASATPDEEKLALEKGFFDFILKPVKEIGLLTRVRRAFESTETLYRKK
jgi:CheY-like chemotaxis protein